MEKFFMSYVKEERGPAIQHFSQEEAEAEAERLAQLTENLGKKVYLLEAIGYCEVELTPVTWHY